MATSTETRGSHRGHFPERVLEPSGPIIGRISSAVFLIGALLMLGASYVYADHYYTQKQAYLVSLSALKPLGWNPYKTIWAARPHAQKMLADQRYLESWYTSIGHALAHQV